MLTIELIYSITAFISLFLLILILIKFIVKRLVKKTKSFQDLNKLLMKIHKPLFFLFLVTVVIHGALTFTRISIFGFAPYILGLLCSLSCVGAALSYYYKHKLKSVKNWIIFHRLFALTAVITFGIHIALTR